MDSDTLEMLRSSLTHVLSEVSERQLSARLDDLGWDDVLDEDAPTAIRVLFETKGETLSPADALGPLLARSVAQATGVPNLQAATLVLPSSLHPDRPSARVELDSLAVSGVATSPPPPGGMVVVPVAGARLAVITNPTEWSLTAIAGTDPDLGLHQVAASVAASDVTWMDEGGAWQTAVSAGRWALSAELVGIGRHVIAGAVAYAGERRQYGHPIGTFQALQHRLAGAHASVVGASHVVLEAASTGSAWAALVAKALAGRAAETACTQAQQTYGAIGFTWEHELHRYLRRAYALDWLLGDWRTLELEIGTRLQATGEVPKIGIL